MCGIAGIYHFNNKPISPETLERMTTSLAHRGPDDYGFAVFDAQRRAHLWKTDAIPQVKAMVGIGNRRLKIIDLSELGHQPMPNHDRSLWLAYNGEVYNYLELRDELKARGYTFISNSDSEVILNAYMEWGVKCFSRFNGMWAMAIFDARDGSLILARDRFGVKPFYVYHDSSRLVFGSEPKALFCHPDVPKQPDYNTIYNYVSRHYRWVDGGRHTYFDGIENLPPAHYWLVKPDGNITEERYWQLDSGHSQNFSSDEEVLTRFRELFSDAVRLRLRSDVPVASMLSGGLDSASVTCMAAQLSGRPITTFSARYDEVEFDEGPYIDSTVKHVGADGRLIYPKAGDLLETLDEMLSFHDEPVCTVTWFAHWMVMKEVAKMDFPVLLNGHVGDELFAGYWDHYQYNFADLEKNDPKQFKYEFDAWLANHERDPKEFDRLKERLKAFENGKINAADPLTQYAGVATARLAGFSTPPQRLNPFEKKGYLTSRLYQELTYETVPATLRPEDRNSMAFSIETRSPFLDYRLAEFAFSLPNRYKIRNGLGKWIIREGMKGILPDAVRTRKDKQGFNAPTAHWFRSENREAVRSVLASKSLAVRGILNQAEVLQCFDDHVEGRANHYQAIWQWLNLELWMRRTFDTSI